MPWTIWIPLMVAACAAALAYVSGTLIERSKRKHSLQNEAYVEYLSAVAKSVSSTPEDRKKVLAEVAFAKCKIVIYGSEKVIRALKEFELSGASTANEKGRDRFISLVVAMRNDSKVSRADVSSLLLGEHQ